MTGGALKRELLRRVAAARLKASNPARYAAEELRVVAGAVISVHRKSGLKAKARPDGSVVLDMAPAASGAAASGAPAPGAPYAVISSAADFGMLRIERRIRAASGPDPRAGRTLFVGSASEALDWYVAAMAAAPTRGG